MSKTELKNSNTFTEEQMKQIKEILAGTGYEITQETCSPSTDSSTCPDDDKPLEDLLIRDERGRIVQGTYNCQLVLIHDPLFAGAIRYNEFNNKIDIQRNLGWKRYGNAYCDNDLNHIVTYMETHYGLKKDKDIERAISVVANDNSYHPIKEKLLSLKWDGISRLPHALHHFLGVEKTALTTESLKLFMLGAVARVFTPGCKFELMLCLVGGQGAGKSTFLRFLAMEDCYFTDDLKRLDDDKVFQRLQGHWIIEMPEMLAILNAKMVEETKSFVSRQSDNYRTPYDIHAVDHPRQCVFAGTSNKTQFLPMDKSGNRRFLPIEVNMDNAECHILEDETASRAYIEQLWAEVMTIYNSGKAKEINPDGEYLFMCHGRTINNDTFNERLRKYCNDADVPYLSSRKLRFTVASTLKASGIETAYLQKQLGHSNRAMTEHYIYEAVEKPKDMENQLNSILSIG